MELLFNTDTENSAEILTVLGFTDADINIERIKPYLRAATRDLVEIISAENYAKVLAENSQAASQETAELLEMVKYAIALDAFRNFAPLNDISFTNDGRLFRRDDHQVGAFEWQIERSNAAMERSYYRAVDDVISYIIQHQNIFELSDFITQFSSLYVPNLKEFQKFVSLNNSHLLYFRLAPNLRICEEREIANRVGGRFEEFKKEKSGLIYSIIQQCCVYYAMAEGVQELSVQLFPEGLMKGENFGKKVASGYDREALSQHYRDRRDAAFKTLEFEIKRLKPVIIVGPRINFGTDDGFVTIS